MGLSTVQYVTAMEELAYLIPMIGLNVFSNSEVKANGNFRNIVMTREDVSGKSWYRGITINQSSC